MPFYAVIYKPFHVLSQFSSKESKSCLRDFFKTPPDVYPVGRLDFDSEGLLILTNDSKLNHRLLHPRFAHQREYWVQVEGLITPEVIRKLASGPEISLDGKPYKTRTAIVKAFASSPDVPDRYPPIRFRKEIPTSWISLTLTEGKNRQVRKMTAKVGLPTLRLIRYRIEDLTIKGMSPGDMKQLEEGEIFNALFHDSGY